jgi:hypothetical protein
LWERSFCRGDLRKTPPHRPLRQGEQYGSERDPPPEAKVKSCPRSDWLAELVIGTTTLLLTTLAYLLASPALGALALVSGGVSYGILIARRHDRE